MGIFESLSSMGHEQIMFCNDKATGLRAIIAIHDTTLGPALGGCRFWNYESEEQAIYDVLRLSRGMTYKASVAGLHLGGGKAVIIGEAKKLKTEALLKTFGRFVHSLGGRYITAEDVNMSVEDVELIARETHYVTGVSHGSGDPSPITALGVYHGIKASVKHKLKKDSLHGLTISIQGCGAVGTHLADLLHKDKVHLIVSDINEEKVRNCIEKYNAKGSDIKKIHTEDVDVFAPCALGAILNDQTIPELKTTVVAGGANNQLLDEEKHGSLLKKRGVLYAPDYVINAGGLINVYHELQGYNQAAAKRQASSIFNTLLEIFKEAEKEDIPTHKASDRLAERRIQAARAMSDLKQTLDNQPWRQH